MGPPTIKQKLEHLLKFLRLLSIGCFMGLIGFIVIIKEIQFNLVRGITPRDNTLGRDFSVLETEVILEKFTWGAIACGVGLLLTLYGWYNVRGRLNEEVQRIQELGL